MPNRTHDSQTRAEARRRARLAARGELDEEQEAAEQEDQEQGARKPTFLERLIPPAPPLPGKPDPLAGFSYTGRWVRYAEWLYLLRQNPIAWVGPGLLWGVMAMAIPFIPPTSIGFLVLNIAQYIALIGAGWIGWQRPWLYGVGSGLFGLIVLLVFAGVNPGPFLTSGAAAPQGGAMIAFLVYQFFIQLPLQGLLGFVAGWYGGYLRRRMSSPGPNDQRRGRRR